MTRRVHLCLFFAKVLAVGTASLFPPYFFPLSSGEGWGEGLPSGVNLNNLLTYRDKILTYMGLVCPALPLNLAVGTAALFPPYFFSLSLGEPAPSMAGKGRKNFDFSPSPRERVGCGFTPWGVFMGGGYFDFLPRPLRERAGLRGYNLLTGFAAKCCGDPGLQASPYASSTTIAPKPLTYGKMLTDGALVLHKINIFAVKFFKTIFKNGFSGVFHQIY